MVFGLESVPMVVEVAEGLAAGEVDEFGGDRHDVQDRRDPGRRPTHGGRQAGEPDEQAVVVEGASGEPERPPLLDGIEALSELGGDGERGGEEAVEAAGEVRGLQVEPARLRPARPLQARQEAGVVAEVAKGEVAQRLTSPRRGGGGKAPLLGRQGEVPIERLDERPPGGGMRTALEFGVHGDPAVPDEQHREGAVEQADRAGAVHRHVW